MTFTLAMVKNPRVWKFAQAEIDAVIGTDRLPELEDRPSLPYVEAIIRETVRWQPVGPVGALLGTISIFKGLWNTQKVYHMLSIMMFIRITTSLAVCLI